MFPTEEGKHSKQSSQHLHPQRRIRRGAPPYLLLSTSTSSSSEGHWSHHPSPTTSLPCNLPNVKHSDGGTDAETYGDITKLGNGIWRSPYPRTKP